MSDKQSSLKESLSALMDNESDELELRRVLRELPLDRELDATWRRYHAVRASLHNEIHSCPSVNLLTGIHARLEDEADIHPGLTRHRVLHSGVLRYFGQAAIAASVAAVALMSVSLLETSQTGTAEPASIAESRMELEIPELGGDYNASEFARTASTDDEALHRLEQAVLRELTDNPAAVEIPVNYTPDFPVQPASAE